MAQHQQREAGRPREFQPEIAAQAALETFWALGYHDVSVSDLEEATGVVRTSLYNTFTNKRGVFDAALDLYLATLYTDIAAVLTDADLGLADVHAFLDKLEGWHIGGVPGCFMVNSMIEFADTDTDITAKGTVYLDKLRAGYEAALHRAETGGELDDSVSVESAADQLFLLTLGLNMAARSGMKTDRLRTMYRSAHDAVRALADHD